MLALTGELLDNALAPGLLPQPFEHEGGPDAPHVGGNRSPVVDGIDDDRLGGEARAGSQKPFQLSALAQVLNASERGDHLLTDLRAVAVAFNDLQIGATAGGFLAEVHGRLISSQHMIAGCTTIIKSNQLRRGTTFSQNPTLDS